MQDEFAVVEIYYSASLTDTPLHTITDWLLSKYNLGLTAKQVQAAFYPLKFDDWKNRNLLNLTGNFLHLHWSTSADDRGPPHKVRIMRQECDEFKLRCIKSYGTRVPDTQLPALQAKFNIEQQHFLYRYRAFHGYFPTNQWFLRPYATLTDTTEKDIYVVFSYSKNYDSPRDTIAVEFKAWKAAIDDAKRQLGDPLPAIVNHIQPRT